MNLNSRSLNDEFSFLKGPIEEFLNKEDIDNYINLKKTLSSHICRNCRNRRVESFNEMLITIHYFVNRTQKESWKRSLMCGVCWYMNYICVNISQMSKMLEKCKSSINGSLQRLYLIVLPNKQQSMKILTEAIPFLKKNRDLLHMWSVRQPLKNMSIPFPIVPLKLLLNRRSNRKYKSKSTILNENPNDFKNDFESNQKQDDKIVINDWNQPKFEKEAKSQNEKPEQLYDLFDEIYSSDEIVGKDNIF